MFYNANLKGLIMSSRQITSNLLMIRPAGFKLNEQTAVNNYYQEEIEGVSDRKAHEKAIEEFDNFVTKLRENGIHVTVVQDTNHRETPDSIFPNNWVTFHHDGTVALYPMFAENRRDERRKDILDILAGEGFKVTRIKDFSNNEQEDKFLEGTGSMILDRDNHLVYAALSDRTNKEVLLDFCSEFSYRPIIFHAYQSVEGQRLPIYHTNVMMGLTENLAIICLECVDDDSERDALISSFKETGKVIVAITEQQVAGFAGNMLSVKNNKGDKILIMSQSAHQSLDQVQIEQIEKYYKILSSPLNTIETLGGGSARCMMAEVFLPKI